MTVLFKCGDRVEVSSKGGWKKDFIGTVKGKPEEVRLVSRVGMSYLIIFDEPEYEIDPGGPYVKGYILDCFLRKI